LTSAFGVQARVIKTRLLYVAGQTRIHVDSVQALGTFVELEVVLQDSQPVQEGEAIAIRLMRALGISEADLVPVSYADLVENHFQGGSRR